MSQPPPGSLDGSLRLDPVNEAQLRLSWTPTGTAASYRVYRAAQPQGPFTRIAETAAAFYEDKNQMGNGATWYYLVNPADICGNEGP